MNALTPEAFVARVIRGLSARKERLLRLVRIWQNLMLWYWFWSFLNGRFGIKLRQTTEVLTCGNNQAFFL